MGLLDIFKGVANLNEKNSKKDVKYSEDELNAYGLSEREKELVRKGLYNPWDFEEEQELNDDDYYNEK